MHLGPDLCASVGRFRRRRNMSGKAKNEINVKVELTLNGAVVHDLLHDLLLLGDRGGTGAGEVGIRNKSQK